MDTIERLRAFAAVAATGSFTAAAERLKSTPQLVSKYVKSLEDEFGVRLFNRTTRRVSMTETGRAFEGHCLDLIEDYEELRAAAREEHARPRGRLLISAPSTFGEMYLAGAIADFLVAYPEIEAEIVFTDRFVDLVEEGFDVAIRIGSLTDSSLIARRLAPAPIVVCAAPAYLARAGRPKTPHDLQAHQCIVDTNLRGRERWPFLIDGERENVRVAGRVRANGALFTRALALAGAGVALSPTYVVGEDIRQGALEILLEAFTPLDAGVYAVYPESRHLSAKVRLFVDFLAKRFSAPPWPAMTPSPAPSPHSTAPVMKKPDRD